MQFGVILVAALFALSSAAKDEFKDDIRKMGKLDENILYDALKYENIQAHINLKDDEKEFLDNMSKDELKNFVKRFSRSDDSEDEKEEFKEEQDSFPEADNDDDEFVSDEEVIRELSDYEDSDRGIQIEDPDRKQLNDPFNVRAFLKIVKSIIKFLKKYGEKILGGIRAIRRAIWRCCKITKKCAGKKWCKYGKA